MKAPKGEVFKDEVKFENCIALIDSPDDEDIRFLFKNYKTDILIYAKGKETIIYKRKDFEK